MNFNKLNLKKGFLILSWGMYDLANQFFALNIVSLYFVRWLTLEKGKPEIFYSMAFGISTFFVALAAPFLGVISDTLNRKRPFLIYLTLLSIMFTSVLGVSKNILICVLFFAIANFGCQTAVVFYNALMVNIAPKDKLGLVSGIGRVFGYIGAVLALIIFKPIVLGKGYQAIFLPTGILFLLFSLPCLIFVKDKGPKIHTDISVSGIFNSVKKMLVESFKLPGLSSFLKASFFGLCAVNVIILFMSIYATKVFGLNEAQIINLIMFSTFFAILGSFVSGYISDLVGARNTLITVFILWGICFVLGAFAKSKILYWFVGSLAGFSLGATWVVSRALVIQLSSSERICGVFGLFNIAGYLSSIFGAIYWGLTTLVLSPLKATGYRISLFSLNIFLILGIIFLLRIPAVGNSQRVDKGA